MLLVFLDTETSGLNPEKHRILEIAFKILDSVSGKHVASYPSIIAQPQAVWAAADPESLDVNEFTWEEVSTGKPENVVANEVSDILNQAGMTDQGGVFICQNPSFDRAFFCGLINADIQTEYGWPYHWLDLASMFWAIRMMQDKKSVKQIKEEGLSKNKIARHFGIPAEASPHRAMNGVKHLIACYEALFGKIGS